MLRKHCIEIPPNSYGSSLIKLLLAPDIVEALSERRSTGGETISDTRVDLGLRSFGGRGGGGSGRGAECGAEERSRFEASASAIAF